MSEENNALTQALRANASEIIDGVARPGARGVTDVLNARRWFDDRRGRLRSAGGRPTDPAWTIKRQIPFSEASWERLRVVAADKSETGSKIGPGQIAAILLERSLVQLEAETGTDSRPFQSDGIEGVLKSELNDPRARQWREPALFFGAAAA